MRALLARAVRAAGHEVVAEAHDAEGALTTIATVSPDVVIIDGRLPPSGANDAVARIRAAGCVATILVVASLAERDLVRAAVAVGASGGLLRPLRPGVLEGLPRP